MLQALDTLIPVLLAISLASERLITILKTLWPALKEEKKTAAGEVDLEGDRVRRLGVQLLAVATSYVTVGLAFGAWGPFASIGVGGARYRVLALAILGSGGSALWNNVIGYTKAAKDVKTVEKAATTLQFHVRAEQEGVVAVDAGEVANLDRVRDVGAAPRFKTALGR